MDNIFWKPEYELGIQEIDEQHKQLIRLLNSMIEAMRVGQGRMKAGDILQEVMVYADKHFKTEETYFVKFKYEDTSAHMLEHKKLHERARELVAEYEKGKLLISGEVLRFLSSWLDTHMQGTDKKYVECFRTNGL